MVFCSWVLTLTYPIFKLQYTSSFFLSPVVDCYIEGDPYDEKAGSVTSRTAAKLYHILPDGGLAVSEVIQSMCLSVLNGEHTLEDCLYQLNTKLLRSEADIEAGRVYTQDELDRRMEGRFAHGTDSKV